MKILILIPDLFSQHGRTGCKLKGETYPPGPVLSVDKNHPKTTEWHSVFLDKFGVLPDSCG